MDTRLKCQVKKSGMRQVELAKLTGIKVKTVRTIEALKLRLEHERTSVAQEVPF